MQTKNTYILQTLIFLGLLIGTGIRQTHLKDLPLFIVMALGVLALISFFVRQKSVFTVLFYIILWTMLYINFSLLVNLIIELFNPNSGWEQSDGESRRVMETNWIWGEIAAFILSPLALLAYHKTKMGHSVIEIGVTVLLVVVTLVVYLF